MVFNRAICRHIAKRGRGKDKLVICCCCFFLEREREGEREYNCKEASRGKQEVVWSPMILTLVSLAITIYAGSQFDITNYLLIKFSRLENLYLGNFKREEEEAECYILFGNFKGARRTQGGKCPTHPKCTIIGVTKAVSFMDS